MASPPPSETCVCGRKSSDHYSIPMLDPDALFCTKRSGHRYVPQSQGADLIREYHKALEALVAAVDNVAPMALEPTRSRWAAALAKAREMLAGYGRADSEKPAVQP